MKTPKGDLKMIIKVSPFMTAERDLMNEWKKITEKFHVTEQIVQLGELFGFKNNLGEVYNRYILDFESELDFEQAFDYINDLLYASQLSDDFNMNDEMLPEILYAYAKPIK